MGHVPSLLFGHGQTTVGVMATSFRRTCGSSVLFRAPDPAAGHCQPTPLRGTPGHSQVGLAQSLVGSLLLSLGSGAHHVLFAPSRSLFPQSCASSVIKSHWPPKSNSLGILSPFVGSQGWESYCFLTVWECLCNIVLQFVGQWLYGGANGYLL